MNVRLLTAGTALLILSTTACQQQQAETAADNSPDDIHAPDAHATANNTHVDVDDSSETNDQAISGVSLDSMSENIEPGQDFFMFANGEWLENTEIPADKSNYGSFTVLADEAEISLKKIVDEASQADYVTPGSSTQKIRDLYRSFMDETAANSKGYEPIADLLNTIDAVNSKSDLFVIMGQLSQLGVNQPVVSFVNQDSKEATQYALYLTQAGLTLPDRDYYLESDDRYVSARQLLQQHIVTLFELTGEAEANKSAADILALETEFAKQHWTRVDNRDRDKTYNKVSFPELRKLSPGFDWEALLSAAGVPMQDTLIIRQPSYISALPGIIAEASLGTWKNYLKFQLLDAYAAYLSEPFALADFEFHRKGLQGVAESRPRWKRAIAAINQFMGQQLGQVYVTKHFQPAAKERMVDLVENLRKAYGQSIMEIDWMGEDTKLQALDKLAKFSPKIGYPDEWRNYSKLDISADDLVGNIKNGTLFEYHRNLAKLGSAIDRNEWFMTPQTVNAYYSPSMNEIVFPAAILQPPFFNLEADDAVNYGGIGAVIGHEMGHGFDDQGSKSDGNGNLRNWWTDQDRSEFQQRTAQLVDQYSSYEAIENEFVNGELTLGENIGDLGGLSIAYRAWQNSLDGNPSPVIDGLTGQQRFFLGWAQVWQRLYRDEELKRRLNVDPHSPSQFRVNGIVTNLQEFYEAFDINPGDAMYTPPEKRVKIW